MARKQQNILYIVCVFSCLNINNAEIVLARPNSVAIANYHVGAAANIGQTNYHIGGSEKQS